MNKKNEVNNEVKSSELRQSLKEVIASEIARLPELLDKLPPEERVKTVIKLLPFFVPQVDKVESNIDPWSFGVD